MLTFSRKKRNSMVNLIDFLIFLLNAENQQSAIQQNKNRGHQTSKIVKSGQRYRNGHLPYHCLFYYVLNARIDAYMTYVACEFSKIRDTKTLNLSQNIVSLQVLGRCFAFFTLRDKLFAQQKHVLQVEGICCKK